MTRGGLRAAVAVLLLAGCEHARPDNFWYADSEPEGAIVTTSLGHVCVTPCRLEIPRWREDVRAFDYEVAMPGYAPATGRAEIVGNPAALLWSNQGLIAIRPNPLEVTLTPVAGQSTGEDASAD